MFNRIKEDIAAIKARDPAARSSLEIFFLYPGYRAIRMHRRAHKHYLKGRFFLARWISERARKKTGIEIHPGAVIGKGVLIDHGSGVVIGETAVVGDGCTIYQGVTLGGTGKESGKRHPTVGSHVMIGAGARILGPFTVGDYSKIAAGAVVLEAVPPYSTCVGVPARVVRVGGEKPKELDQIHMPDPVSQELCRLGVRLDRLGRRLDTIEKQDEGENA
ncbi:MAG: serine O-acetyltransferase [Oscillospiraceae bacterium]|jgi:serine O-acetyltransferase|nr:serine O-acetyltransferase [Oscillospiraceae bacterium]